MNRPRMRSLVLGNVAFTAVALVILSPWACVSFAGSGTSLSWFVFGEVLEFVILALVLARGGIVSRWWLGLPPLRAVGMALATFASTWSPAGGSCPSPGWRARRTPSCGGR